MDHGDRRMGVARSGVTGEVTCDDSKQCTSVWRCQQCNVTAADVLVPRWQKLVLAGKVDPQLKPVK